MSRKVFIYILFTSLIGLATNDSIATSLTININQSAFNKLSSKVGSISDSGQHKIDFPYPCFKCTDTCWGVCCWGELDICYMTIYSAIWNWTISNVIFNIKPSGITYSAILHATYGFLSYESTIQGTADFSVSGNNLILKLSKLNIPVTFDFPGIGQITVTTIDRDLQYNTTLPIIGVGLKTNPPTGAIYHKSKFFNINLEYLDQEIRVKGDVVFW